MENKKYRKLDRLIKIVFDLFPPEELKKYEKDGVSLPEQYRNYCIKNTFTFPLKRSKRTIEIMALFLLHEFHLYGPRKEFDFDMFDVFFL